MKDTESSQPQGNEASAPVPANTIQADNLFQGHRQVLIEHDGEIYRLVLTRNNKLLLQK